MRLLQNVCRFLFTLENHCLDFEGHLLELPPVPSDKWGHLSSAARQSTKELEREQKRNL